ncbi:MAG: SpoIIE family protein phosphatase [Bacilli bacterium]|nr:SpoIIE family protein phosphatase [Bacilli bacterium]
MFDLSSAPDYVRYLVIILESLLVVVLAVIFYLLEAKTKFKNIKWIYRQIIIGVVFGGAAIFGTEMGISIGSAVMNVRDAAPLVAGLIFGGPAGMIAATIGSVERLLYTYVFSTGGFNRGEYSVVACVIATFVSGLYAWALRQWFFEKKTPHWLFGFATAAIMEVLHFILLYLTNIKDPKGVLTIIMDIFVPMILANGIGVALSCLFVELLENRFSTGKIIRKEHSINSKIQIGLLALILVTATMSTTFVIVIQNNYANETANRSLEDNVEDIDQYIRETTDSCMDDYTYDVMLGFSYISSDPDYNVRLRELIKSSDPSVEVYSISYANIVAYATEDGHQEGDILYSSDSSLIGKNILEDKDSYGIYYLKNAHDSVKSYIVKEDGTIESYRHVVTPFFNGTFYPERVKVGNISLQEFDLDINGYLQVVCNEETFYHATSASIDYSLENYFTKHRRVYLDGYIVIHNYEGTIISYINPEHDEMEFGITIDEYNETSGYKPWTRYEKKLYDKKSFFMYEKCENYYITCVIPATDLTEGRNMMIIVYTFMLVVIYASVFFVSYVLMKNLVIKNIRKINNTLALIIKGDLSQKVSVNTSIEFTDLSNDINITVDTLKKYIKEAEERIDKELAFAKTIQSSSLPSVFPAFPGIKEFDIFAAMNTAKEVGGDFYDFYFVDADHFAFLVADVSGKGIPASMFMMESKALLKNTSLGQLNLEKIFNAVNQTLCQGNDANMFVTCWMGIIDLKSGVIEFANAGHNAPLVFRYKEKKWSYIDQSKDLVLAGLETTKYHVQSLKLLPGDCIYLYTDGVTEATNINKELYGEERLIKYLNKASRGNINKLLPNIQKDIDKFVNGAEQFDDITMLAFEFKEVRK